MSAIPNREATSQRITIEYGLPDSLNTMTEDEAIRLAMMLSVEDEEARENWMSHEDSAGVEDLDLDGWSLDDQDDTMHYESSSISQSLSLSMAPSPTLSNQINRRTSLSSSHHSTTSARSITFDCSPLASNRPASERTSPYFEATQLSSHDYSRSPQSNEKLQLSPRLQPTYGSFGQQPSDLSVPDMDENLWPSASSSLNTSRRSTPVSAAPIKRGWNDVVQSSSPSPARSHHGIPSLLSTQLKSMDSTVSDRERREDEELKFAIELSLVEERSKKDS